MKQTIQNKWIVCSTILLLIYIPYLMVNHIPLHRRTLPFILGEENIPFIASTSILYASVFAQALVVLWVMPRGLFAKVIGVIRTLMIIHLLGFILMPTEYPREEFKSTDLLLELFRVLDTPGNCFPSLHVSCAILFACLYSFWQTSTVRKILMWIWAALIIISVLTVKQHYLIDVLASIVITTTLIILYRKNLQPQ